MRRNRKRDHESPRKPPTLRAESRRLFPEWTRRKRAEWVLAKLYVAGKNTRYPIGEKALDRAPPDFLRALPRDGKGLVVVRDLRDVVHHKLLRVRGMLKP